MLLKAGFICKPGKGGHTKGTHPLLAYTVTLSGKDGEDAKHYQEKDVQNALKDLEDKLSPCTTASCCTTAS